DFVEKIARSAATRSLLALFSRTTCLCTRPLRPGSDSFETIAQSACAVAVRTRQKNAFLRRRSRVRRMYWTLYAELILFRANFYQRISAPAPENADRYAMNPKPDLFSGFAR